MAGGNEFAGRGIGAGAAVVLDVKGAVILGARKIDAVGVGERVVYGAVQGNDLLLPRLKCHFIVLEVPETAGSGNKALVLVVEVPRFVIILVDAVAVVWCGDGEA